MIRPQKLWSLRGAIPHGEISWRIADLQLCCFGVESRNKVLACKIGISYVLMPMSKFLTSQLASGRAIRRRVVPVVMGAKIINDRSMSSLQFQVPNP